MIYESVIITCNPDDSLHIVPIGYREENNQIIVAPFRPSRTLNNLETTGQAVLNMTDNVAIIAGCLTGNSDWPTRQTEIVKGAYLTDALTHLEVKVNKVIADELRPKFICNIVNQVIHKPFKGFNRAQAAVIEAAILVSRLSMLSAEKIDEEITYLKIAIDKTAGEQELIAWTWLMDKIANFRQGQTGVYV